MIENTPPQKKLRTTVPRGSRVLLFFFASLTLAQVYFVSQLTYNYDIEQLFSPNDPELQFHEAVEETFANPQHYLILGVETERGIYNEDFLTRLDSLTKLIAQHPLIREVNAPTNLRYPLRTPGGVIELPFLHPHQPSRYVADSTYLHAYPDALPKFISRQHTAVCAYVFLHEALTDKNKQPFRAFLEENLAATRFDNYHIYADVYAHDSYLRALEAEMYWLSGIAVFMILVILLLSFRSVAGVLLPILIVLLTVVWTLGTLSLFGYPVNMMTVLLPTIVGIISLSDVIHVINRLHDYQHLPSRLAIARTFREMRTAILLTSLTTGLGFGTLAFSQLQPFVEFGLFTLIGIGYAYGFTIFLLPILLRSVSIEQLTWKGQTTDRLLQHSYQTIQQHPRRVFGFTLLLAGVALVGASRLQVNSYLYEELSAKDEFSQTLRFFETHFSGIRTFQLHLEVTDTTRSVLDDEVLRKIDSLENYLLHTYGLRDVYSIATQVKRAHRVHAGGEPTAFRLPADPAFIDYLSGQVLAHSTNTGLKSILTADQHETRITGKMPDLGSARIRQKNRDLQAYLTGLFPLDLARPRLTGHTLLLDQSNQLITYHLLYGLLFAVAVVSLLMGWLYRSFRVTLLALLPNLLPLLLILGLIGWVGLGLKMSTVVVFTIAFGIAVDDTIHFMSRLKTERQHSPATALRTTFLSTGKAIVITSVLLILGFGVLLFSAFQTTFLTGLLVSLALLFALFADLVLLPVLLKKYL